MNPVSIISLAFTVSTVSFALAIKWYAVPVLRTWDFSRAVTPFLLLHSFRHLGLIYLLPAAIPNPPPDAFAIPTAYGDLMTVGLALLALAAVRLRLPFARAMVWVFNIVGFVDLCTAVINATRLQLVNYEIGFAYLLPAIVVPLLLVTHIVVFWLLLRRTGGHDH
jgi:hypothetical protein